MGVLLSWQSALAMSGLSRRFSWPLIGTRWHDCWDIEHCDVSAAGYVAIVAFIVAPSLVWAIVGWKVTSATSFRFRLVALLVMGTIVFYACFYALVWS